MPLRLEIKRKLTARSERVKSVDFHPREPWIVSALYSGHLFIWNHQTQALVKSIDVCALPVRCAKFIAKKQWIICGADDMFIRIYNYNTMERVHQFEAHTDYIRSLAIHPSLPYVLSSSDDMFIKLWDWEKDWNCQQVFEGHGHYVMQIAFNPKDTNTFASASLDRTVKVWGLNASVPHFSLEGHERGVNCVAYFKGGDRPYLVSGADDFTVKVWDYQTKACVTTMEGHTGNVSSVCFHPTLPIIVSGSEDGTVRIWHSSTYRQENTLSYGMDRVWSVDALPGSNKLALGYDDGTVMVKLGQEEPVASMESGGKVAWAKNQMVFLANLKAQKKTDAKLVDGERMNIDAKELGLVEIFPQTLQHDPRGRYVCVCGDGEFTIYTALKLANRAFGSALEFVWGPETGCYATRESTSKVKVYKDWKEHKTLKTKFSAEALFGGQLLAVRSSEFIVLYDWDTLNVIRRIDVCPRKAYWSELGTLVLACDTDFFVLRYHADLVQKFLDTGVEIPDKGIERAFEVTGQIAHKVRTGHFVGDCFLFTNAATRLCYCVGGEVVTLAHLSKPLYLLGYLDKTDRVYLIDKEHQLYSYELPMSVLLYQMAIVRGEHAQAAERLKKIPVDQYNKLARFLEGQNLIETALEVSQDPEHRFELAMQCKKLDLARDILGDSESEHKWKQLGDVALNQAFDLKLAEESYTRAKDLSSLLLIYTSVGDAAGMLKLAKMAEEASAINVAFICYFLLSKLSDSSRVLVESGRVAEAAFLTRTYSPSNIDEVLELWKRDLRKVSEKAADALASPSSYPDLFPDLAEGVRQEKIANETIYKELLPASSYPLHKERAIRGLGGGPSADVTAEARPEAAADVNEDEEEEVDEEAERRAAEAESAAMAAAEQQQKEEEEEERQRKEQAEAEKAEKAKAKKAKEDARKAKEEERKAAKAKAKKEREEQQEKEKREKEEQEKKEKEERERKKREKEEQARKEREAEEEAARLAAEEAERERLEAEEAERERAEAEAEAAAMAQREEEERRRQQEEDEAAASAAAEAEAAAAAADAAADDKPSSKKEKAAADKAKREAQRKEREAKRKAERERKRKEREEQAAAATKAAEEAAALAEAEAAKAKAAEQEVVPPMEEDDPTAMPEMQALDAELEDALGGGLGDDEEWGGF